MNQIRRVMWGSAVFFVLLLIVLWAGAEHWPTLQKGDPRIHVRLDQRVKLPRDAVPTCDEVRDEARDFASLRLAVEGMDTGLQAVGCEDSPSPVAVFVLRRIKGAGVIQQSEEAAWAALLGRPIETIGTSGRALTYDIRWIREDVATEHLAKGKPQIVLQIFQWWSPVALLIVLYVWAILIYLAHHTALVRDPAPEDTPLERRTYSLSKVQMAWWFAIVFAAFIFLWLVTGEIPSISAQALSFLGISSVTTMASTGIASNRTFDVGRKGEFFVDLLSDTYGVAIHRFQMLVMTIALGLIFLFDVATKLTMPAFDASLLTLMGLSAATFVALKIPEQRAQTTARDESALPADAKSAYTPTS